MKIIDRIVALGAREDLAGTARHIAVFSLADWMACGLAGQQEPVAIALRGMVEAEGGAPVSQMIGGGRVPARAAALVNGATSHALDYDDTHFAHVGHPSVAIAPAALAAGEATGASIAQVIDAFLVGAEVSVRLGIGFGRAHYTRGFHQTATAGAFGATVAAGRLYGLTQVQMRAAIGLCSTRAGGLRNQFGTMGKPYNAGIAAATGVEVALLARAGLSAPDDGLEGALGFVATHCDAPDMAAGWADPDRWLMQDVKYKLHACCHGTHAMIEALRTHRLRADQVQAIHLRTNPRWLTVCDIKHPRTGLEIKFSYGWLAAMVLAGHDTASEHAYTDTCAADPALAQIAARVQVTGDDRVTDLQAQGSVTLTNGQTLPFVHDLAAPIAEQTLQAALQAKARALLGDGLGGAIWATLARPDAPAQILARLLARP
jgi:2-methylcitrate dehydratase PrpD